jgi:hypothetical protein
LSQPRFLADENVPLEAIRGLQADGHDVVPVLSVSPEHRMRRCLRWVQHSSG